ncbi:transposase [Streptomyces lavendofoliae]|uniref:transposase n=1 Tax=Streptomyces lavendofoliae TaxID=67314 RepID=UPI003D94F330
MEAIRVPRLGPGRPRTRPNHRQTYHLRNAVERCFSRLKQWRGLATRYDRTRESCQATVTIASILLWL